MKWARASASIALVFVVLTASPAVATCYGGCGGGAESFSYDTEYLYRGETVTWRTSAYIDRNAAGPEDGPFYAYLVAGGSRVSRQPIDGGVLLGVVDVTRSKGRRMFDASLTFTVPADAALGSHLVEVCDEACDTRLGYMMPTAVMIGADQGESQLFRRVDRLTDRVNMLQRSLPRTARKATLKELEPALESLRFRMALRHDGLDDAIAELEESVRDLRASRSVSEEEPTRQSGLELGILAVFLAGIFSATVGVGSRTLVRSPTDLVGRMHKRRRSKHSSTEPD